MLSREPVSALARRYGITRTTVYKWRGRSDPKDAIRPPPRRQISLGLTAEEEAIIVGFRKLTMLPLDDCLYAMQEKMPGLTRSSLHRCLQRHGVSRLPLPPDARRSANRFPFGSLAINWGRTMTAEGRAAVIVATDLGSRLFFAEMVERIDEQAIRHFVSRLIEIVPYAIRCILVPHEIETLAAGNEQDGAGHDRLGKMLSEAGIEHGLASPDPRWATLQGRRLGGEQGPAEAPSVLYESKRHLSEYLFTFMHDYNFKRRLKVLDGKTPYQKICEHWEIAPDLFKRRPRYFDGRAFARYAVPESSPAWIVSPL